ncbi:MAG: alanine--tRNA ligase [Anaerovoracaceae bacterium]|nr:alanine--tRNA ligase [Bacillota bacterium]MDY2671279.1 alanine--tRNA ligase [Anaerovoracaceae bacterium]
MEKLGLNEIRKKFLEFYKSKGHLVHESFPLIPDNDKSLMLINSGMAPLKPYFSGLKTPPSKRMTTCQKCIRTGDIENIGYTERHGTFFEMMGNFSFGDYFKEQSITWGWEFITEVLKLPEDKIWATIYLDDDEAHDIWRNKIGMPEEHIVRLGKEDNFWEIGIGPCGPCSEIYFDRGEEYGCGKPDCKPGCECDRYMEFWNHVFTQFDRHEDGTYTPLAHPNIDTGMGLERIACIMQGTDSIFDIDTIQHILRQVEAVAGVKYESGKAKTDISIRIITDHIRSVTFMISDGILPSNEGRGYVLRRLLRRAARHGKLLGINKPFLADLTDVVVEVSGEAYPALVEKHDYIKKIVNIEEEKFAETIDQGTNIINSYIDELTKEGKTVLPGDKAFKLYDTYGFPLELTTEILAEHQFTADEEAFNQLMEQQRENARNARKSDAEVAWQDENIGFFNTGDPTEFTGYDKLIDEARIEAIIIDRETVDEIREGQEGVVILNKTPFYAEMGGQVGDRGTIEADGCVLRVNDTVKAKDFFVHKVKAEKGSVKAGDTVTASVDPLFRNRTARNHTATHILQAALKQVLGDHVSQAGSLVNPDELRFDFTHFEALSAEEIQKVEDIANDEIAKFEDVNTTVMSLEEAKQSGATALFDDKYADSVRVVSVGDFSKELCGGTHVSNSGQIGAIKIVSESGVASGVRRIVAITGDGIAKALRADESLISDVSSALKTQPANLITRIGSLEDEIKSLKKELEDIKAQNIGNSVGDLLDGAKVINGVKLVTAKFDNIGIDELRAFSDELKGREKGLVNVLAAVNNGKVTFLVSVSDELVEKGYHAGKMIKEIAKAAGGGGGGKANMAQAGAKDASKIDDAFAVAETLL